MGIKYQNYKDLNEGDENKQLKYGRLAESKGDTKEKEGLLKKKKMCMDCLVSERKQPRQGAVSQSYDS